MLKTISEGKTQLPDFQRGWIWDDALKRIDTLKAKGLDFLIDKIPPWHVDRFNLNKIMDVVYQRILSNFMRRIEAHRIRVVFDDYGVGDTLKRYIRSLENAGAAVIVTHAADSSYLETKLASVVAKREREKVMEAINNSAEFKLEVCSIGSGNAGDPETLPELAAHSGQFPNSHLRKSN